MRGVRAKILRGKSRIWTQKYQQKVKLYDGLKIRLFSENVGFWDKYDPRESTIYLAIWPSSDLKKSFDKVFGNFENMYLRNAIKTNYGGGLGRFKVWSSKHWKQLFFS